MKISVQPLLDSLRTTKFWKEFLLITIGMLLSAMAVYYFLLPANLIIGTVSGLAIVLSGVLAAFGITVKVSLMVTILNVILIVLALLLLGRDFGVKTIYASLILGPMMDLCEAVMPYEKLIAPGTVSVMGGLLVRPDVFRDSPEHFPGPSVQHQRLHRRAGHRGQDHKQVLPHGHRSFGNPGGIRHLPHGVCNQSFPACHHRTPGYLAERDSREFLHGHAEPSQESLHCLEGS